MADLDGTVVYYQLKKEGINAGNENYRPSGLRPLSLCLED